MIVTTKTYMELVRRRTPDRTIDSMARCLGISRDFVYKYANGECAMTKDVAARVAKLLDLPSAQVIADISVEIEARRASTYDRSPAPVRRLITE